VLLVTSAPSLKGIPSNSDSTFPGARMRRHDCSADSITLNVNPRKVACEIQLRVRVVPCWTIAKVDSIQSDLLPTAGKPRGRDRRPADRRRVILQSQDMACTKWVPFQIASC